MVSQLRNEGIPQKFESTQERIHKDFVDFVKSKLDILYTPELVFDSPTFAMPNSYQIPCFNVLFQVQPEKRGLPVLHIRMNVQIAASRHASSQADEEDRKVLNAMDGIHSLCQTKQFAINLGVTSLQLINSSTSIRGNTIIGLLQIEMKAFKRAKER